MDWVIQFEGQMLVASLLAKALYGAPDRQWLDLIAGQFVLQASPFGGDRPDIVAAVDLLGAWSKKTGGRLEEAQFAAIQDDYTRLFIGPNKLLAAPWESVYTNKDRAVFQMESVSVKNWYARFGLAPATPFNEPADHVGLEFAFVAFLAQQTIEASEIRDGAQVQRLIAAQRGFIGQHMVPWVPRWADDVATHARTDFYRGLASLARGTVLEAASFFAVGQQGGRQTGAFQRGTMFPDADGDRDGRVRPLS